jgi:hypothetical protein
MEEIAIEFLWLFREKRYHLAAKVQVQFLTEVLIIRFRHLVFFVCRESDTRREEFPNRFCRCSCSFAPKLLSGDCRPPVHHYRASSALMPMWNM